MCSPVQLTQENSAPCFRQKGRSYVYPCLILFGNCSALLKISVLTGRPDSTTGGRHCQCSPYLEYKKWKNANRPAVVQLLPMDDLFFLKKLTHCPIFFKEFIVFYTPAKINSLTWVNVPHSLIRWQLQKANCWVKKLFSPRDTRPHSSKIMQIDHSSYTRREDTLTTNLTQHHLEWGTAARSSTRGHIPPWPFQPASCDQKQPASAPCISAPAKSHPWAAYDSLPLTKEPPGSLGQC